MKCVHGTPMNSAPGTAPGSRIIEYARRLRYSRGGIGGRTDESEPALGNRIAEGARRRRLLVAKFPPTCALGRGSCVVGEVTASQPTPGDWIAEHGRRSAMHVSYMDYKIINYQLNTVKN